MLNVALNERNMCEDFDLDKEILFFKIGAEGLVSFHGYNFSRKIHLTDSDLRELVKKKEYFPISSSCYINVKKMKAIVSGMVYFGGEYRDSKMIPVSKRTEMKLKQLFVK